MCRLYENSTPFYTRDLNTHGSWYLRSSWNQSPKILRDNCITQLVGVRVEFTHDILRPQVHHSFIQLGLIHTTTWMKLENIMLSKRSQSQNTTYCMIIFIENVQNREIHTDRKYSTSVCLGLGIYGNGRSLLMDT